MTVAICVRIWERLCDPNPCSASAHARFLAALTARLHDRELLIAVAYPILLPVVIWAAKGQARADRDGCPAGRAGVVAGLA